MPGGPYASQVLADGLGVLLLADRLKHEVEQAVREQLLHLLLVLGILEQRIDGVAHDLRHDQRRPLVREQLAHEVLHQAGALLHGEARCQVLAAVYCQEERARHLRTSCQHEPPRETAASRRTQSRDIKLLVAQTAVLAIHLQGGATLEGPEGSACDSVQRAQGAPGAQRE
jgi:hypothetical protein